MGPDASWIQYDEGADASIVCFNLSLPQGRRLADSLSARGVAMSLIGVNDQGLERWDELVAATGRSRRVVILDDTKSVRRASVAFEAMLRAADGRVRVLSVARDFGGDWLKPQTDELEVDDAAVLDWLSARTAARG